MPSRKTTKAALAAVAAMPGIPKELIDQFVAYFGERDRPFRRIVTEAPGAGISPVPAT